MPIAMTQYTFNNIVFPYNIIIDDTYFANIGSSNNALLYSGNIQSVSAAIDAISSIIGSGFFSSAIPICENRNDFTLPQIQALESMFPNSYFVPYTAMDNKYYQYPVSIGNDPDSYALHIEGGADTAHGSQVFLFSYRGTTNPSTSANVAPIGYRCWVSAGGSHKQLEVYFPCVFQELNFDFDIYTFHNFTSSTSIRRIWFRWQLDVTNTTNFWIYSQVQTAGSTLPTYMNRLSLVERPAPGPTPTPSDDPYGPEHGSGPYSDTGGGPAGTGGTGTTGTGGLHDDSSDSIPTPSLPSEVATGSGLFTAYNPSTSQLAYFADKLWNADPTTIGDLFRLMFGGDAFNAIIGLHLLPVAPVTSGSPNIMLGNWDSGAPAPKIINQYKQVPFGSVLLPEYWGNAIDYSPYTRVQLALPYIGIVDVDTDDVLGSTNTLTYNIDVLSGAICATLHCVKGNLTSVLYQWSGSCAVSLPITGSSFNAVLGAVAGIGAAAAGTFALASGPVGAAIGAVGSTLAGTGMLAGAAANTFGTMKGKVQKSGAFGANSGALGIMTPYFIVTRPVQSVPSSWQADKGYPANISAQLGTVTGYTEVSEINLECSGTEAEKKEIIDLLKKGVLF